ncbi:MAG: polysaccharide biosynthesis protein [Actinobacteria bacterium]|nr:polysaccharide biosynthesis protein [Thermoleophilia bacterium]MCB9011265.1 polysaccharide biosynthesis protein [Actinomycetota bacterium]
MSSPRVARTGWALRSLAHRVGQALVDVALVSLALWLAFQLRFDWEVPRRFDRVFEETVLIIVAIKMLVFVGFRFYTKWWRFTSLRDLQAIVMASILASLLVTALFSFWRPEHVAAIPRGVLVADMLLTLVLVGGARFLVRSIIERPARNQLVASGKRVLVCGAGNAGHTLIREMQRNRTLGYVPIGLVDDDTRKHGMRVMGVKTRGGREDLPRLLREHDVDEVIIAMPSAPGSVRREIAQSCRAAGVTCKTLPGLPELITGDVTVRRLREVRVEDVLGRAPIEIDLAKVARYLNGRTVMVTGAGGSIGSELCRQVAALGARRLVMIDHAENNLFEIDLELRERGWSGLTPIIGDCKDEASMRKAFADCHPDIVFHAAAYKHVPMMELNPLQAVANNALATELMADLAEEHGVERFCLISTDKAVEPKTVMGATKALAERVIEERTASSSRTRFAAVRFGNVLGSSGSVLPIFRRQIAAGGPVTVTHAEMTRFFMTIPEAVQLVIEATGIAEGGDIFVLDMGEPVRILDLAHRMIELSGHEPNKDIKVEVVGIRPGEKLHEELFNVDEQVQPTRYGKVMRATRAPLPPALLHDGLRDLRRRVSDRREVGLDAALATTLGISREHLHEHEVHDTETVTKGSSST